MTRTLLTLAALTLTSLASAQRVVFPNGAYDLQSCYGVEQGTKCDFLYTPLEERRMSFQTNWFVAVAVDGRNVPAQALSVANANWATYPEGISTFRNVPVKLSVLFPTTATTFPVLTVSGTALRNVPVGSGARAATQPQAAQPAASAYDAVLTNCAAKAGGVLVCTATLTPRR